ncbi:hypothetical protein PsorP6_007827 [Peronosclerospora sorghi]|uniref:Uncharacterized protein n=1 Tax=Peronosclerospora sorghi TaxID=230839 RepID=A0ACC0W6N2_9STRA|nr:hypothetical protein PsorP6_007827 [Peronosclerospora sorghi]
MGNSNTKHLSSPTTTDRNDVGARSLVTCKDRAILDLKNARDRLKKYQSRLDLEAKQLHESAIKLLKAGKRDRAKLALKLKKYKEQQMQQADDHLLHVLQLLDTVEWETQQLQVFEGLKAGNSILNALHAEMTVEAVDELMLETAEAQAMANEISRLVGGSLTVEDEDAVLSELAELEKLQAASLAISLPEAPITVPEPVNATVPNSTIKSRTSTNQVRAATKKHEAVPILGILSFFDVSQSVVSRILLSFFLSLSHTHALAPARLSPPMLPSNASSLALAVSPPCVYYTPWCDPASFALYLTMSLLFIGAAGLMAGLTMGLLSLDMLNLRILELEGSDDEKTYAKQVLPLLARHHFLLVTLLIVNASANEALPLFLTKLVPEAVSIGLSVTCVLVFGEILPSAVFTGPNQLQIAARLCPLVRCLMLVTGPIAYPLSRVLDSWLGHERQDPAQYKRREIKALVMLQRESERRSCRDPLRHSQHVDDASASKALGRSLSSCPEDSAQGTRLRVDEVTIIHGALDLAAKTVTQVMIPMARVYMLDVNTALCPDTLASILASGHSRIPVYEHHDANIVGLLLVKKLIVVDPDDRRPLKDLLFRKPILVSPRESCYAILNEFQKGRSHIALVTSDVHVVHECWRTGRAIPPSVVFDGIVTIEDVIEELIQEEIEDESDVYVHDIVHYWQQRYGRVVGLVPSDTPRSTFVTTRLRHLAERARRRVAAARAMGVGCEQTPLLVQQQNVEENK